ncbi:protein of unknown function [Nitrospira defluvii]|jgi:hypothetical protein|uniref:Uncharacterized protein n=1 Tax=Nitrospira defluvii TaxID=330214 RepID=D8P892_9BACT|nr:protein of unknown function [Nitrospira defluvii]
MRPHTKHLSAAHNETATDRRREQGKHTRPSPFDLLTSSYQERFYRMANREGPKPAPCEPLHTYARDQCEALKSGAH